MCEKDKGKAATWVGNGMNIPQANRPFWTSMTHAEPLFKLQRERSQRQDWRERERDKNLEHMLACRTPGSYTALHHPSKHHLGQPSM